jgi:hypothetical protein
MLAPLAALAFAQAPDIRLHDAFGRDVSERGIVLVDWEGQIANPRIGLEVRLPDQGVPYPVELHISGTNPRIHFDREDPSDRTGVGRRFRLPNPQAARSFFVTVFPDADGADETHELLIQLFAGGRELGRRMVPVRVIDQDTPPPPPRYPIHLDYSEDRTGFFDAAPVREVVRRAAQDWEFFLDDQRVDPTPAGTEPIAIWNPDGFVSTRRVHNSQTYTGFLLWAVGIRHAEMRAGGTPSLIGKAQTRAGEPLPLRRSGQVLFDTRGNYNLLGWWLGLRDDDWWVTGSLRQEPSDFYSIAMHEMGHALAFEGTYPLWREAKRTVLDDPLFVRYTGVRPAIDASDHLAGVIDPSSGYGSFGNEYHGTMKTRRWLITKSHLLALRAVGYRLRMTSAFREMTVRMPETLTWRVGEERTHLPEVAGGVPAYYFEVLSGNLPAGLQLDSFTGAISGTPRSAGATRVRLKANDGDLGTAPVEWDVELRVD